MKLIFSLAACALSVCSAAPLYAQTISGCGTITIAKADQSSPAKLTTGAECFAKAKATAATAEATRRTRLAALVPAPVASTQIGINVAGSSYFSPERTFANLASAGGPWLDPDAAWGAMAREKLNADGYPRTSGVLPLNVPQPVWSNQSVDVVCTWKGGASVRIDGDAGGTGSSGSIRFTWRGFDRAKGDRPSLLFYVTGASDADPLRDLDCREPGLTTVGQFDKRLVDDLKPFKVLRFLDWGAANGNPPSVTWANRTLPDRLTQNGVDGIALEHAIDLANAADADAWFALPWNADEDYVRRAGALMRDRLGPGRRAYVELSNEVWNGAFSVSGQALREGQAEKLSDDAWSNVPLRAAEKTIWFHKILTDVFRDHPERLVRVVGSWSDVPWYTEQLLAFRDLPQWIDAVAIAPYFGHELDLAKTPKLDDQIAALQAAMDASLGKARAHKVATDKYSKMLIAYEGGQHVLSKDVDALKVLERDTRMEELYRRYITGWRAISPGILTLYAATGTISQYGAWGIREYAGQPLSETPKRRAVLDALSQ